MTLTFKKIMLEGQEIPRGYGIAYPMVTEWSAVCYPIPLNIVVGWLHAAWVWLRTSPSQIKDIQQLAYKRGWSQGNELGWEHGVREGIIVGQQRAEQEQRKNADNLKKLKGMILSLKKDLEEQSTR